MVNSRAKGKRGEREGAKVLNETLGTEAKRGQQFCGLEGAADVVGIPGVHIEVKREERMKLYEWLKQADRDNVLGLVPIVLHRKNKDSWIVSVRLENLLAFMEALHKLKGKKDDRDRSEKHD